MTSLSSTCVPSNITSTPNNLLQHELILFVYLNEINVIVQSFPDNTLQKLHNMARRKVSKRRKNRVKSPKSAKKPGLMCCIMGGKFLNVSNFHFISTCVEYPTKIFNNASMGLNRAISGYRLFTILQHILIYFSHLYLPCLHAFLSHSRFFP